MNIDSLFQSKKFQKTIVIVGITLAALVIFQAGVFVGVHKAGFSYRMGDNYYRTFGNKSGGSFFQEFTTAFPDAHGATGKIVSVHLPTFVMEDQDQTEKIIRIGNATIIKKLRGTASTSDITAGEFAVIIGAPNQNAEVEAALIRLMPPPPEGFMQIEEGQTVKGQ
ncbi:MAG: hypothetical protein V4437_01900 [Patescibacteria group bacterium]